MGTVKTVAYAFKCDYRADGRRCHAMTPDFHPDGLADGVVYARREARERGWTFTSGTTRGSTGIVLRTGRTNAWCPKHPKGKAINQPVSE